MYDTILVPTDGSDGADRAVDHAFTLASQYDARVHAMYCVETSRYGEPALSSAAVVLTRLEDQGQELLDALGSRAEETEVEFTSSVCHGQPWEEVLDTANELDADLVVIGSQGLSHTRTDTLGSVAERIVRSADRPVLTA